MANRRGNKHDYSSSPISEAHDNDIIVSTREIFLHGHFENDADSGIDCRTSNAFLKNLRILESIDQSPIIIHQHSIGGEWESGMMIYDAIRYSNCKFIFICHGIAASMGSIVPQAVHGKGLRLATPNCSWLIHEGEDGVSGTIRQFQSYYEFSKLSKFQMYDIYGDVCKDSGDFFSGQSITKVKSYLRRKLQSKEDWWFTAEEAVKYGFVDGILGSEDYPRIAEIRKSLV